MNLSKKQVKALLDVISSEQGRGAIFNAYVDTLDNRTVLVATDGYKLVALDAPGLTPGKFIARDDLIKWYKLASAKDVLTDETAGTMARDDDLNYPNWQPLIDDLEPEAMGMVALNASYMMTLQTLKGAPLELKLHGRARPMIDRTDNNTYVIMPLKTN